MIFFFWIGFAREILSFWNQSANDSGESRINTEEDHTVRNLADTQHTRKWFCGRKLATQLLTVLSCRWVEAVQAAAAGLKNQIIVSFLRPLHFPDWARFVIQRSGRTKAMLHFSLLWLSHADKCVINSWRCPCDTLNSESQFPCSAWGQSYSQRGKKWNQARKLDRHAAMSVQFLGKFQS